VAFIGAASIAVGVCFLLYFREDYLPSGNVEFREFTYRAAWQQFLDSPIWGTAFSAESVRKFTLFTVGIARNRLPTHSDLMDLLANGGLLAIGLWLFGYLRIGVFAYRRILAPRFLHYPWASQGHTFAAISLAAIVVYAFNPILLQPEMAFMVWTTLGMLVGLAASCDPELHAGEIARRFHAAAAATVNEQRDRSQSGQSMQGQSMQGQSMQGKNANLRKSRLAFVSLATRVEPPQ
jgi:O-antigen ligase